MAIDNRIGIRMTTEEKEQLEYQANEAGLTITEYIKWLVENDRKEE